MTSHLLPREAAAPDPRQHDLDRPPWWNDRNVVTDLLERTTIMQGDFVVVVGPGPIGLRPAMAARAGRGPRGGDHRHPRRRIAELAKAKELGFTKLINIGEADPVKDVLELHRGRGADIVAECSGSAAGHPGHHRPGEEEGQNLRDRPHRREERGDTVDKFCTKVVDLVFNMSTSYTSWTGPSA